MINPQLPPLEYLFDCPLSALQEVELKMLDLAAQAEKRAKQEYAQAIAYRGAADVYRFLALHRSDIIDISKLVVDGHQRLLKFRDTELLELRRSA